MAQKKQEWQIIHLSYHEVPCILLQTEESTKGITLENAGGFVLFTQLWCTEGQETFPGPQNPSAQRISPLQHCSPHRNATGFSGQSPWEKMRNKPQAMLPGVCKSTRMNSVPYFGRKGHGILALVDLRAPSHMHTLSIKGRVFSLPRNAISLWVLISSWTCKRFDPRRFTSHA